MLHFAVPQNTGGVMYNILFWMISSCRASPLLLSVISQPARAGPWGMALTATPRFWPAKALSASHIFSCS